MRLGVLVSPSGRWGMGFIYQMFVVWGALRERPVTLEDQTAAKEPGGLEV